MIYVLAILCAVLFALLSLIIGYNIGKTMGKKEVGMEYMFVFLDQLERACIELDKPQWFEILTEKMKDISKDMEDEE